MDKKLKRLFISWYDKTSLEGILDVLKERQVEVVASDGTAEFLRKKGISCLSVSEWIGFPPLLEGRVKTLHPLVFASILARDDHEIDQLDVTHYSLKPFDAVLVELYPFEKTLRTGAEENEMIEKIDIGGVSLIRAAAKNYHHVLVISRPEQLFSFKEILLRGYTTLPERKKFAKEAFSRTMTYDATIYKWFSEWPPIDSIVLSGDMMPLRYGENPDQEGFFVGDLSFYVDILQGKTLSYNNILDVSAALTLLKEFNEPAAVVIKHGNACGVASHKDEDLVLKLALASDPLSAFGGIIAKNRTVTLQDAEELSKMFFEILIAPDFTHEALAVFRKNEKRILLRLKSSPEKDWQLREVLFGYLLQTSQRISAHNWELVAGDAFSDHELEDALFGVKVVKHLLSNAIVIVKDKQLIGAGMGQPNRVDAVRHAIEKAHRFGFSLDGSILVSDGFFPFTDSLELALEQGIRHVVEPGGSLRDKEIIQFCQEKKISLIFTHQRYFKH